MKFKNLELTGFKSFVEKGFEDNCQDDPYEMSSPKNILKFLEENSRVAV